MSGRAITFLATAAVLSISNICLGQGYREAEIQYNKGELLMEMRDYPRAIFAFRKAYGLIPDNRYLAGLVKALARKGEKEKALVNGEKYLDRAGEYPDQEVVETVRRLREELGSQMGRVNLNLYPEGGRLFVTDSLGERRTVVGVESPTFLYTAPGKCVLEYEKEGFTTGRAEVEVVREGAVSVSISLARAEGESQLVVESNVDNAIVRIDGRDAGRTPLKVKVPAGDHIIQVWARNHLAWTGVIDAPALRGVAIQAHLVPAEGPVETMPIPKVEVEESGSFFSWSLLGWACMVLGAAAGGFAGYEYFQAMDKWAAYETEKDKDKQDKLLAEGTDFYYMALGAGAAGGILLGGGLLMVLLDDDEPEEQAAPFERLTFMPGLGPKGLVLDAALSF